MLPKKPGNWMVYIGAFKCVVNIILRKGIVSYIMVENAIYMNALL